MTTVETERLLIRNAEESDRERLVGLFTDPIFTTFSSGVLDVRSANARFDRMLDFAEKVPYAKQPIIEKATETIIGYTGVDSAVVEGIERLEWGWRLAGEARGHGYATEATMALLDVADSRDDGEMLCIVACENQPSHRVAGKVGFVGWKRVVWSDGVLTDLLVRPIGGGGAPLTAPETG